MESKEKVLDKIKKLLKLQSSAEELGNEGEAYAAANAVHRLLTTYNLSLGDISDEERETLNIIESDEITYRSPYGSQWKRNLLALITENNYCRALAIPSCQHMIIVGQEDNVAIVKQLYNYLVSSFSRLSTKRMAEFSEKLLFNNQQLTEKGKKKFISSYLVGAIYGLQENYSSIRSTLEETGLMVCHDAAIKKFLGNNPDYSNRDFKERRTSNDLMPEAVVYGQRDGQNISLNRQIQG